jgi:LuxR family transcriptional regulator, maltose regulon positive regulatory protein
MPGGYPLPSGEQPSAPKPNGRKPFDFSSHALIPRPRLIELLNMSLECPLTLVSAPAGFGKTTLLSTWVQSLPPERPRIAWVSLDEGDNEPVLFWMYVLTALDRQQPGLCTQLVTYLQTQQAPPLRSVLQTLINRLAEQSQPFLLILDDYHLITEQAIHTSLTYLVEHLPPQLHLILATRTDPPLPVSLLRARGHLLEVRTDELRCNPDEAMAFLKKSASIQLSQDMVEAVTTRTEGWLFVFASSWAPLDNRTVNAQTHFRVYSVFTRFCTCLPSP